jgi:Caspase domain
VYKYLDRIDAVGCGNRFRKTVIWHLAIFILAFLQPLTGQAQRRKALIIGNSAYGTPPFSSLNGVPVTDGAKLADALVAVGFARTDITFANDLNRERLVEALTSFRNKLESNDSVLFYFSGHGFSIDGKAYVVPIGFTFGKTAEESRARAVGLDEIIDSLLGAPTRVIVLDACRTSAPVLKQAASRDARSSIRPLTGQGGIGSLVAYATAAGKSSSATSDSGMSLFTNYFVKSLESNPPPADMREALEEAQVATETASRGEQIPAIYNEMYGEFVLSGRPKGLIAGHLPPADVPANPYQQVLTVVSQVDGLEKMRAMRIQSLRSSWNNLQAPRTAPQPETLSDDLLDQLLDTEQASTDELKELAPTIKRVQIDGVKYLGLAPIPQQEDDQRFQFAMRTAMTRPRVASLRAQRYGMPFPRFDELKNYLNDLATRLGHTP